MRKELKNRVLAYNRRVAAQAVKAGDLDIIVAAFMKLPPGQLKKMLTIEVLAVLRKYGMEV